MYNNQILIADDEKSILKVFKKIFTESNTCFDLEMFCDGKYLLDYFIKEYEMGNKIPLCILDIKMPLMDGLTAAKKIREIDPEVIIIIITGQSHMKLDMVRKNLKKNIYYIRKPFNREEFFCLTDSLIKGWNKNFELNKYRNYLESLVRERTEELMKANKQLEKEIEEQRKKEELLKKYEKIISSIHEPMIFVDENYNCQTINDAYVKVLKKPKEEFIGKNMSSFLGKDFFEEKVKPKLDRAFSGRTVSSGEWLDFPATGKIYADIKYYPHYENDKKISGVITSIHDITKIKKYEEKLIMYRNQLEELVEERTSELVKINEKLEEEILSRKEREKELQISKDKFRFLSEEYGNLLKSIPDKVGIISTEFEVLWSNTDKTGEEKSHEKKKCYEILHNASSPCINCPVFKSFCSGKEERENIVINDREYFNVVAIPVKSEDGNTEKIIAVARDITRKVNLEKDAFRTSHMASVGELVQVVAHEINNPLTSVINYSQLLVSMSDKETQEYDISSRIAREGERINKTLKRLVFFAHPELESKRYIKINQILSDTMALIHKKLMRDGIKVNINMPEDLPEIIIHSSRFIYVFLSILYNARKALNKKYPKNHENKIIEILGEKISINGDYFIRIVFSDYGCGIPEDILHKVASPFFTTEDSGKATGLGLTLSFNIIKENGGRIFVESKEWEFTRVTIDLPGGKCSGE